MNCPECSMLIRQLGLRTPRVYAHKPSQASQQSSQNIFRQAGQRIRNLREGNRLTRAELAHSAGIKRSHLYRIENGNHNITIKTLAGIASALNVKLEDILKWIK